MYTIDTHFYFGSIKMFFINSHSLHTWLKYSTTNQAWTEIDRCSRYRIGRD